MVGTEITVPRWTSCKCTTLQRGMAQNGEEYFRVNVFYLFLDYMLTELNDRFLRHRTNAFALQCLVTSSLIEIQPAIELYQNVLSGTTFDVEAEFTLWRAKCISGSISADKAFDAFEYCPSVYSYIKFLLQILTPLPVTTASAVRTFSILRSLKTWLRSSMNDDRLQV